MDVNEAEYEVVPVTMQLSCKRCLFKITGSVSLVEAAMKEHNESRHTGEQG